MRTVELDWLAFQSRSKVGMKPLSERDENKILPPHYHVLDALVGMKPLSERDENPPSAERTSVETM